MGWTVVQSLYFTTVTVTTVGYGDFTPDTDNMKLFACLLIFLGLTVVGSILDSVSMIIIAKQEESLNSMPDEYFLSARAARDASMKVVQAVVQTVAVIALGTAFMHWNEGWSWLDSLYFVIVTGTTVGYGDELPERISSQIFCIFYILLCVTMVSVLLGVRPPDPPQS